MRAQNYSIADSQDEIVVRWLRRRLLFEAISKILEGCVFGVCGLIVIVLVSAFLTFFVVAAFVSLALLHFHRFELRSTIGGIFGSVLVGVLMASVFFLKQSRWGTDYSITRAKLRAPTFPNSFGGVALFVCDLIPAGGRILLWALAAVASGRHLLRCNARMLGPILLWLWVKNAKAYSDEILARFPGVNTVWILPQLREIDGIIWLPGRRGVFIMSAEFRREFAEVVPPDAEPEESARDFSNEQDQSTVLEDEGNSQIIAWYATLELQPYVPIREVRRRYRQLAKVHHPDVVAPDARAAAQDRMVQINLAYENIVRLHKQKEKGAVS